MPPLSTGSMVTPFIETGRLDIVWISGMAAWAASALPENDGCAIGDDPAWLGPLRVRESESGEPIGKPCADWVVMG